MLKIELVMESKFYPVCTVVSASVCFIYITENYKSDHQYQLNSKVAVSHLATKNFSKLMALSNHCKIFLARTFKLEQ